MQVTNSFFFSKILYKSVCNVSGAVIGKLNDLILDFDADKPVVKVIEIKSGNGISYITADFLEISKDVREKYLIKLNSSQLTVASPAETDIFLARDFLDKQIVDVNGKKVERVNDVRLGKINGQWKLVAVDIGLRGLVRRLGVEYPAIRVSEIFKFQFRNKLIFWDNVEPLATGLENLKLSTSLKKLKTLHAADIADIIEELDNKSRNALFQRLDDEQAADVLEEIEADVQLRIIETLSDEKVTEILENMPADEAADILEEIEQARAERILTGMEAENSEEIRQLMVYDEKTVGSIMSKEFVAYLPDISIRVAVNSLKSSKPKDDELYHIYVINNRGQLLGAISLIDLITADMNAKLYDVMQPAVKALQDRNTIQDAMGIMQKYNLVVIPVINKDRKLVGIASISDLLDEYIRLRKVAI